MPQRGRRTTDELILTALVCGATLEAAAQKAGVSKSTVQRRLRDAEFCRRRQELSSEMVNRSAAAMTAAWPEAFKTLVGLLGSSVPPATRLGAVRLVFEMGIKLREVTDMEARLRALEEQMAKQQSRK
jgi:hypothetical protein